VLLVRVGQEGILLPQLRAQETVSGTKSIEDGLDKVTHGTGVTARARVAIIDTGHVQQFLSSRRRNQSGTTRGRHQTHADGTTLSSDLAWDSVGHTSHTSPVSTTDGGNVELGSGNGSTNGSGNLGGALDSKSQMSSGISNGDKGLETCTLTGRRLLLDGHDFHNLILELVLKEVINNLGLLDGKGKEENLLNGSNLLFLYQASKFGNGNPDVLFIASTAT